MNRIAMTTRLTIALLLVALVMSVYWNLEPASVRILEHGKERFRYKVVGPGWPFSSYEYEFERQEPNVESTVLFLDSDLKTRSVGAPVAAWAVNVLFNVGLLAGLIANICRAVREAREPQLGT